jgi:hypothetical protein
MNFDLIEGMPCISLVEIIMSVRNTIFYLSGAIPVVYV